MIPFLELRQMNPSWENQGSGCQGRELRVEIACKRKLCEMIKFPVLIVMMVSLLYPFDRLLRLCLKWVCFIMGKLYIKKSWLENEQRRMEADWSWRWQAEAGLFCGQLSPKFTACSDLAPRMPHFVMPSSVNQISLTINKVAATSLGPWAPETSLWKDNTGWGKDSSRTPSGPSLLSPSYPASSHPGSLQSQSHIPLRSLKGIISKQT